MLKKVSYLLNEPVKFFLIVAGLFGIFFILVIPPFQAPDEAVHFYRAYQISQLNFIPDYTSHGFGGNLPRGFLETEIITSVHPDLRGNQKIKYNMNKTRIALHVARNQGTLPVNFATTAYYSPISYIPQVTGIWVGQIVHGNPIVLFYAARFSNLLFWLMLSGLAIRILPKRKWALVTILLLPPLIAQSGSISADAMTNGAISLFIATIFYLRERHKTLANKQLIFLIFVSVITSLSKQMSFVLLPLLLLVPSRFREGKSLIMTYLKRGIVALPAIILALLWYLTIHRLHIGIAGGSPQATVLQTQYILAQPFEYFLTFLRTYFFGYGDSIYSSVVGSFGWDITVSLGAIITGYLLIWYALWFHDTEEPIRPLTRTERSIVVATGLLYLVGVSTALYIGFTQYKRKYIEGIQGRYLYPLLMMLAPLALSPKQIPTGLNYKATIRIGSVSLLAFCALMVYLRYYVHYV